MSLLDVPPNKTSGNYTKPVHSVVGQRIEEWERIRSVAPAVVDEKTGEECQLLFCYRGRPIAISRSLAPAIGIPGSKSHARGKQIPKLPVGSEPPDEMSAGDIIKTK